MSRLRLALIARSAALAAALAATNTTAKTVCTAFADANTGTTLLEQGDCTSRVTPASTFKIAISLMGYDARFLKDAHAPTLPFREGYLDWGGDNWRKPIDPSSWMKYSVVWYSQQVTTKLGAARFQHYVDAFDYGNRDVSGAPGKHDGLTMSWIGSSLKISPKEQLTFLRKVVTRTLPVSAHAFEMTGEVVPAVPDVDGWRVHGKTGTGSPKGPDGQSDTAHAYGWFVGWVSKGARTLVFARLIQDDKDEDELAGLRARAAFVAELPALLKQAIQ